VTNGNPGLAVWDDTRAAWWLAHFIVDERPVPFFGRSVWANAILALVLNGQGTSSCFLKRESYLRFSNTESGINWPKFTLLILKDPF
jgi:hypothetical protein